MTPTASSAHAIDVHVGRRLRFIRRNAGLTQKQLAEALGCSFQQVQKYESSIHRLSASALFLAAQALQVGVAAFFLGLPEAER